MNFLFCFKRATAMLVFLLFANQMLIAQGPVQSVPMPHSWKDNNTLIMVHTMGMKRVFYEYNIKKEKMTEIVSPVAPKATPTVTVKNGDVVFSDIAGNEKQITFTSSQERNPVLSPDFKRVAYTRDNNLYSFDLEKNKETRLTFDGSELILNGWASWVYYEEIFGRGGQYRAFWWSPDSRTLAFYRFDDSMVPMFPIYDSKGKHGSITRTRYPKAGDSNPEVKLGFVSPDGGEIVWADFNEKDDQYFGTPFWAGTGSTIMVQWMDRDQSNLILYAVNVYDGSKSLVYKEYQKTWINWMTDMKFGKEGFYFVRDFELWEHIYYQSYDGNRFERLTDGMNWGLKILDVDEKNSEIHFSARRDISVRNDIYKVSFGEKGKFVRKLSEGEYNYAMPLLSPDKKHFTSIISNTSTPLKVVLLATERGGAVKPGEIRVIADTKKENFDNLNLPQPKLVFLTTPEGYKLPGVITLPHNFDAKKRYPVIMSIYGGPNSSNVMDTWRNPTKLNHLWADEGVIQISVDNRASGHCGKEGINYIHRNLGYYELQDYVRWAKYLADLGYVDADKVGITGFSYGGTMTVLALTDGAEYFRYGIAGAGVYDWMLYDTHYTERYMDHPDNNPDGYRESAAINKAGNYTSETGSLLYLTHGLADDNVHMQNTIQLIDALQKEGKQFELMFYPGAFHGYRGHQGAHSEEATINFWRKVLLGK